MDAMNPQPAASLYEVVAQSVTDPTGVFVQYGALGVIALLALLAVRVLFQRETRSLDLERQRADRLEEELRRLNESIHQQYIPVLTKSTEAIARALDAFGRDDHR